MAKPGKPKYKEEHKAKHSVSVRLTDAENNAVMRVADANRMSKSDVIRTAISGEMAKIAEHKDKDLSDEQRDAMLRMMGKMMTHVSEIRHDNARLGNNVNQVAKALNNGGVGVSQTDAKAYADYADIVDKRLGEFARGLDAIWRLLI